MNVVPYRILLLWWLGLAWSPAQTIHEIMGSEGFTEVKTIRYKDSNCVFVSAQINGHELRLLIDTGSQTTVISQKAAERYGIPEGPALQPMLGVGGVDDHRPHLAVISQYSLGGVELNPSPVVISDFHGRMVAHGIRFDGILGLATLKANHAIFSFVPALFFFNPHRVASSSLCSWLFNGGFVQIRPTLVNLSYRLPVSINGRTMASILDSGAEYMVIDRDFAEQNHLQRVPSGFYNLEGIDGHWVSSTLYQPGSLSIAGFPSPPLVMVASRFGSIKRAAEDSAVQALLGFNVVGTLFGLLDAGNDELYLWKKQK